MTTYRLAKVCSDFKGGPTIQHVRVTASDREEAALVALAALGYWLEEVDATRGEPMTTGWRIEGAGRTDAQRPGPMLYDGGRASW